MLVSVNSSTLSSQPLSYPTSSAPVVQATPAPVAPAPAPASALPASWQAAGQNFFSSSPYVPWIIGGMLGFFLGFAVGGD